MRTLLFSILAVVAILSGSTLAVKGVISDTLTSDEEGCLSLCGLNDACLLALYQTECRECWLMDCSLQFMPVGFTGGGKDTIKIKPTCDSALVPKPREDGCKDAPAATTSAAAATTTSAATATTTSGAARSSETGVKGSATWRTSIDWLPLGAVVMANIVVAT
ncbi:uncharacterized protein CC84DRAFT_1167063 [Paraphaeosphaeria sporulosa]|uniref:Apple domain-containing protein n=1 Tax=Paraphaeosphaeria sporulosa TaxID=1460663 RepID=A0A177C6J1_9PLEO|nr:uncharacterized protein CC84DRAFT_1167063 [Paraphaeosphaeria sporulosa]OAG03374.1 hypothetical protein CC84DRAFT_1167063 [Paraphaeosphaeria sporulosa]